MRALGYLLRHLLAIVVLPFSVAVAIPYWMLGRYGVDVHLPSGLAGWGIALVGLPLLCAGLALFCVCLWRFARQGGGTLAPWDPPQTLVVEGPYRFVRNPMISAVVLVLFAEALLLRSLPHGLWAGIFLGINGIYIPLLEEPDLEARFGDDYRRYKANVPRVLPRLRPWNAAG